MAYVILLGYVLIMFLRPQEWYDPIKGMRLPLVFLAITSFAWLFTLIGPREGKFRDAPQNSLIVGLFGAIMLSHIGHTYFFGLQSAMDSFKDRALILLFISMMVSDPKRLDQLLKVIIVGGLILTLHGILQGTTGSGFGGIQPIKQQDPFGGVTLRVRFSGIFGDPNDLALMLVMIIPLLLQPVLTPGTSFFKRVINLGLIAPMTYCIFLTNSRGGWLALAVMVTVVIFLNFSKKLGVLMAVLGLAAMMALGPSRMGTVNTQEGSARGRILAWGAGNRMLKESPLWGAGYRMFDERSGELRLVAHNSYVHCWGELGLIGYFFWLSLLIVCLKDGWKMSKSPPKDPELANWPMYSKALLAGLVGYMAAAVFLSRTYIAPLYLYMGIFAAMRTIYVNRTTEEERTGLFTGADYKYVLALELVSIPALWIFIRLTGS